MLNQFLTCHIPELNFVCSASSVGQPMAHGVEGLMLCCNTLIILLWPSNLCSVHSKFVLSHNVSASAL